MAFAWQPPLHTSGNLLKTLVPDDVLYFFDTPMLFTSKSVEFPVLCYKVDEDRSISQYIVAQTNKSTVEKLKAGAMAVSSALSQPWVCVAEATSDYKVTRSAGMSFDEIPEIVLPMPGYGLDTTAGVIFETGTTENPFLTFNFTASDSEKGTLPFGIFKSKVDELYKSILKIFEPALRMATPDISEGILRRALTVPTYEPAFGSLLIAIEKPRLDFSRARIRPRVNERAVERNVEAAYEGFLNSANAVASAAGAEELTTGLVRDHMGMLDAVAPLIPTTKSFFQRVEISGHEVKGKRARMIQIDAKSGDLIKEFYELASLDQRTIDGTIVEVSDRSKTFIVRDYEWNRETTCIAYSERMRDRVATLSNGMEVTVQGAFHHRPRRDKLWIDRLVAEKFTTVA